MRGGVMKPGRASGPVSDNVDPVCGMQIKEHDPQRSSRSEWRIVYFCSRECKADFDGNPAKWAGKIRARP